MLTTGILATFVAVVLTIYILRTLARANAAELGWMSEQWLAEHRASHPTQ